MPGLVSRWVVEGLNVCRWRWVWGVLL